MTLIVIPANASSLDIEGAMEQGAPAPGHGPEPPSAPHLPHGGAVMTAAEVPADMIQPRPTTSRDRQLDAAAEKEAGARFARALTRRVRRESRHVFRVESRSEEAPRWVNLEPGHPHRCECPDAEMSGMPCAHALAARLNRGDDFRAVMLDAVAEARAELARRGEFRRAKQGGR